MRKLKYWQKWGLFAAVIRFLLGLILGMLGRVGWWYQETIWYRLLIMINYPAAFIHDRFLDLLKMPSLYDAPIPWYETLTISASGIVIGFAWWFLLGAFLAVLVYKVRSAKEGRVSSASEE